jgi:hypothetical protein
MTYCMRASSISLFYWEKKKVSWYIYKRHGKNVTLINNDLPHNSCFHKLEYVTLLCSTLKFDFNEPAIVNELRGRWSIQVWENQVCFHPQKQWLIHINTWIKSIRLLVSSNHVITWIVCICSISIILKPTDNWCSMWRLNMAVLLLCHLYHRKQMRKRWSLFFISIFITDHSDSPLLFSRQLWPRCTTKISEHNKPYINYIEIPDLRER